MIIVGEQQYLYQDKLELYPHNRDLLVSRIDSEGRLIYNTRIPKDQYNCRSIFYYDQGEIYLFYMDNIKNKVVDKDDHPEKYTNEPDNGEFKFERKGYFTACIMDAETGEYEKNYIASTKDYRSIPLEGVLESDNIKVSNNEFVFNLFYGRKNVLVKISVN